jgi:prepilin-type N-terminal cleavage/methylation domain-containing protein
MVKEKIKISTAGKLNKGFTLLELLVVIALITITLFFSLPRFQTIFSTDDKKNVSRWIIAQVLHLKKQAIVDQKQQILHVDMDGHRFWVTDEQMSLEEAQKAKKTGYRLPKEVKIMDVEYPDEGKVAIGTAQIRFSKNIYSDFVLIHMKDRKGDPFTFLIEPFLWKVRWYDDYVGFSG